MASKQGKQFFFEKKNQKTVTLLVYEPGTIGLLPKGKNFLVVFFKKELLTFFARTLFSQRPGMS